MENMKPVLCVGLVCLDQVTVVDTFPKEDTDQRSIDQYKVRGGNANNSCTVLAHLGFKPTYYGTLATGLEADWVVEGMREDGVIVGDCPRYSGYPCPNSVVITNSATGSRTIIHTNLGLPELTLEDFIKVDLHDFSWVHIEGRNKLNVQKILSYLNQKKTVKFSVEIEKVNRGFEEFIPFGDVVFISKDVAQHHGYSTMEEAVGHFQPLLKTGGCLVIAWGEAGACGWEASEGFFKCPAFSPAGGVVDTLGAGDTFNGAVIGCLASGLGLRRSVNIGCQVAGRKVGFRGFKGLDGEARKIIKEELITLK